MSRKYGVFILAPILVAASAGYASDGNSADEASQVVLSTENTEMWHAWPLKYGQALQKAFRSLDEGRPQEAIQAAKMYFTLCPADGESIARAIRHVKRIITAVDGNQTRATQFERYALHGPRGPDGTEGTEDDLADPLAEISLDIFTRGEGYFSEFDAVMDARVAVTNGWDRDWYKSEKAFERLNCAAFQEAARLLVEVVAAQVKLPHAPEEENWELKRVQRIIDRAVAGLGVVYRARKGTFAGLEEFQKACIDYATYGPLGPDRRMGTADDLRPPM